MHHKVLAPSLIDNRKQETFILSHMLTFSQHYVRVLHCFSFYALHNAYDETETECIIHSFYYHSRVICNYFLNWICHVRKHAICKDEIYFQKKVRVRNESFQRAAMCFIKVIPCCESLFEH